MGFVMRHLCVNVSFLISIGSIVCTFWGVRVCAEIFERLFIVNFFIQEVLPRLRRQSDWYEWRLEQKKQ